MDRLQGVTSSSTQNPESNLLDDLRREAENDALRIIQAKLEKPESLNNLDQLRTAAIQRKHTLDDQIRTAVHSQLESIRIGITQLEISLNEMKTVERTMHEADEKVQKIGPLRSKLEDLGRQAIIHRQISLAQDNLDYIIKTPENVKKANEFLEQEKLLQAHQLIMEIGNSRNYLLFELHNVEEKDSQPDDIQLVTKYFADYEKLVAHLQQLISSRISRWYDCAKTAPEKLVTALRIIEREEQVDRFWREKKEKTGFSPPDRPKQWRQLCFDLLKKTVINRIEGNQLETREENKLWLTRHLEMCRRIFLKDFEIITQACTRCFPQQYDIINRFLDYYHDSLKKHLTEICNPQQRTQGDTLTTVEVYTILTFIREYKGEEHVGKPELNLNVSYLTPLLDHDIFIALTEIFINERKQRLTEWISKIVSLEVKDWYNLKEIEFTPDYHYVTSMPRMFINMIIETLTLAKQMSDETCRLMLDVIFQKINEFYTLYVTEIKKYAKNCFDNRKILQEHSLKKPDINNPNNDNSMIDKRKLLQVHFAKQMIANANNCESIVSFMSLVREKYDRKEFDDLSSSPQRQLDRYDSMGQKFERIAEYCCDTVVQEIESDTKKSLKNLFTRDWFGSGVEPCCGQIIATTRDYWNSDLTHLKKPLLAYLFYTWHKRILSFYLRNLFSRNTTPIKFSTPSERRICAQQLRTEAEMLFNEFKSCDGTSADNTIEYYFNILSNIADVLQQTDLDSILLDVATLAKKYPSLTIDQMTQILLLRGDLTAKDAKDKADAALANMPRANQGILFEIMEIINQNNLNK